MAWIETFWATLQAEVLDRQHLADLAAATAYAAYNYHRLHGKLGWRTSAERLDGTRFVDRGFEHVQSLTAVADLLANLLAA